MIKNHACHAFEPKYIDGLQSTKNLLNESTLLLVTCNGREHKMIINNVKPCSTLECSLKMLGMCFLNSIKTKHQNCDYNLGPNA